MNKSFYYFFFSHYIFYIFSTCFFYDTMSKCKSAEDNQGVEVEAGIYITFCKYNKILPICKNNK